MPAVCGAWDQLSLPACPCFVSTGLAGCSGTPLDDRERYAPPLPAHRRTCVTPDTRPVPPPPPHHPHLPCAGLAGALAFLKDRGELDAPVEWSGRSNDYKKVAIQVRRSRLVPWGAGLQGVVL